MAFRCSCECEISARKVIHAALNAAFPARFIHRLWLPLDYCKQRRHALPTDCPSIIFSLVSSKRSLCYAKYVDQPWSFGYPALISYQQSIDSDAHTHAPCGVQPQRASPDTQLTYTHTPSCRYYTVYYSPCTDHFCSLSASV